jgi:hypothetical protein
MPGTLILSGTVIVWPCRFSWLARTLEMLPLAATGAASFSSRWQPPASRIHSAKQLRVFRNVGLLREKIVDFITKGRNGFKDRCLYVVGKIVYATAVVPQLMFLKYAKNKAAVTKLLLRRPL